MALNMTVMTPLANKKKIISRKEQEEKGYRTLDRKVESFQNITRGRQSPTMSEKHSPSLSYS